MQGLLEECNGVIRKAKTVSSAPPAWNMMSPKKRTRKDLDHLYGMSPVPDSIYEMIMRADNGNATPEEMSILDSYILLKTEEIKETKRQLGYDRRTGRQKHGRIAMSPVVSLEKIVKQIKEEDDYDER